MAALQCGKLIGKSVPAPAACLASALTAACTLASLQEDATVLFVPLPLSEVYPGTWRTNPDGAPLPPAAAGGAASAERMPAWPADASAGQRHGRLVLMA